MKWISIAQIIDLHNTALATSGGAGGIRDREALRAACHHPKMTFYGVDVYPTLTDKAAALCFSLVMNHPFVDGNKRVGHAAMEAVLLRNGFEIGAEVAEQEQTHFVFGRRTLITSRLHGLVTVSRATDRFDQP
jgi:death-on-curing protein